jgi:hypothetical protein
MEAQPNLFLRALSGSDYLLLNDTKIGRAYFPHDSVLSLIVFLSDGESIAVGIVGRDGVVGASAALGAPYAFYEMLWSRHPDLRRRSTFGVLHLYSTKVELYANLFFAFVT